MMIITCNAGSTNLKLAAFDAVTMERKEHAVIHNDTQQIKAWFDALKDKKITVIGHRVVHGGREFTQSVLLTGKVIEKLEALSPLAPLHQPAALRLIRETCQLYPDIPQIACFDTAFHRSVPAIEKRLPLPEWFQKEGIERYGFHGLSYQYIASVLPKYTKKAEGNIIVAHLGGGSSACALRERKSVATTMGFSTLDGMMMGTRCGAIDPGIILYLLETMEMRPEEISRMLYLQSGLQGVSGISSDMRQLLASDSSSARNAIELYCHLAARQIAGLLPALGGIDALIFTGGIGENAAPIRESIINALRWISNFEIHIIPTDEEFIIAQSCH